jgi:GcrA cell cycle regulator
VEAHAEFGGAAIGWTDERVTVLKRLWLEGLSASQIAKQLGGVTRNAVIGKVHRLGLSGRAAPSQPSRPAYRPQPRPRPAAATPAAATPAPRRAEPVLRASTPAPAPIPDLPGTATVLTLGAHMCKWPIGDPSGGDFSFCGRRTQEEGPYCVEHARVAYQPPQKKKTGTNELVRSLRRYI